MPHFLLRKFGVFMSIISTSLVVAFTTTTSSSSTRLLSSRKSLVGRSLLWPNQRTTITTATYNGSRSRYNFLSSQQPEQQRFGTSSSSFTTTSITMTSSPTNEKNEPPPPPSSSSSSSLPISPRILETLDPCVVLMKELIGQYSHLWKEKGGIFSLAQGIVYWEPPVTCTETLQEALLQPNNNILHTYGPAQGIPELVEKLQNKIAIENQLTNHHVMVTVGANQAYMNIVLTCLGNTPTSKAIVFAPYYFNHVMAIQMCCGNDSVVIGPCTTDGIPNVEWLQETLEQNPTTIHMVTIVNPGNPTGVSLSKSTLQQIVDICQTYNVWVVLDCTYEYFTQSEMDQPIVTFPNHSNVIHIFSFSKSYSLAGYRCGYIVLSKDNDNDDDEENTTTTNNLWSNMIKVQDTLPIGAPRISQIAAIGALKAGPKWVRQQFQTLDSSRKVIRDALTPLQGPIMGGSGAMYFMAQLPTITSTSSTTTPSNGKDDGPESQSKSEQPQDDIEVCRRLVEEYGIAVIPGSYCGFPGWIRVCYANLTPDKCLEAAERLKQGLIGILQL